MLTINGIGTKFYGKNDIKDDGSYITTKWSVFLMLPLFPLASYRVKKHQETSLTQTKYDILKKVSLNKNQVMETYGIGVLCIALFIFIIIVVA